MDQRITNPATGETIRQIKYSTENEISSMIEKAKDAQNQWRNMGFKARQDILRAFASSLEKNKDQIAHIQAEETGKPISQAEGEANACIPRINYLCEEAATFYRDEFYSQKSDGASHDQFITFESLGTILNISAWNYPLFVSINVVVPALLTGNAVVFKPSEYAIGTGEKMVKLLWDSGVPKDILQLVIGAKQQGENLLKHDFDGVFFTGSYSTGKSILNSTKSRFTKVGLELGGKDPAYVRSDADVKESAISLCHGAFYNAGQSCCAVERIYVHSSIINGFVDSFLEEAQTLKIGSPLEKDTYFGPLTRGAQIQVLESQIEDALKKGASIRLGGKKSDFGAQYFEPTVLTDVSHDMDIMREESFGPIIGIMAVDSDEEALRLMQDTQYGLTSAVYTQDIEAGKSILREIDSGTAYINCCDRVSPCLPWSGRRNSGLGSTLGKIGIQTFLQPKSWHIA